MLGYLQEYPALSPKGKEIQSPDMDRNTMTRTAEEKGFLGLSVPPPV